MNAACTIATSDAGPSPLVASLFPRWVSVGERREPGDASMLYASEAAGTGTFAERRLAEFAAGRACARFALGSAGFERVALPRRQDRSPEWPLGVVGSISHTLAFCAAAVAPAKFAAALGIDAERTSRLPACTWNEIFVPHERYHLAATDASERARHAIVMFSAKESFYKCQYPLTQRWIDFEEVSVTVKFERYDAGSYCVSPESAATRLLFGNQRFSGRFCFERTLVVTGMAIAA